MTQQTSPFVEGKYGWSYGEDGWNVGADENWLKYGYLLDNNVNGVVSALPTLVNGESYFLTTDSRFYFAVGGNWYSSPCPKWFIFKIKDSGDFWWYDGVSAVAISNPQQLSDAITTIQSSLGTAAYVNIEDLVTQAELAADAGSSLVGFKQAGAGAVPRTVQDKVREISSVTDFGAVGDGISDDTAAFENAILYSKQSKIFVPCGKYKLTRSLVTDRVVYFVGETPERSRLYFYNCDGISINALTADNASEAGLENISVCAVSKGTNTGYKLVLSSGATVTGSATIKNTLFSGADLFDDVPSHVWPGESSSYVLEWGTSIELQDADGVVIDNCAIRGKGSAISDGFDTATIGLRVSNSNGLLVNNSRFFLVKDAMIISGQSEGARITCNEIVGTYSGTSFLNLVSPPNNHYIVNNHYGCRYRGVVIGSPADVSINGRHFVHGNFFLKRDASTDPMNPGGVPGYVALEMNCTDSIVSENIFQSNYLVDYISLGDYGAKLNGTRINFTGNAGYNCGTLVYVDSTAATCIVASNRIIATGTATSRLIQNASGTTAIYGNMDEETIVRGLFQADSNVVFGFGKSASSGFNIDVFSGANRGITYDTRLEFVGGGDSAGLGEMRIRSATLNALTSLTVLGGVVRSPNDGTNNLGAPTFRWATVYASTGTINTSDAREKQQIRELSEVERAVALRLKGLIRAFKFNDAVAEKGSSARIHIGVIAQDVKAAFEAEGLVAEDYAILCYDEWEEQQEIKDEEGNIVQEYRAAGNRYGVRYEELLTFIIGAM